MWPDEVMWPDEEMSLPDDDNCKDQLAIQWAAAYITVRILARKVLVPQDSVDGGSILRLLRTLVSTARRDCANQAEHGCDKCC
jgi:hypothetical protein